MLDMNIAVIGAPGAGKTTFMRKALGLPENTPPAQCHRKWTIDGIPYAVRLVELKIDDVHPKPGNTIEWPKTAHGTAVPRIDAAITVYDVTVKESLASVPDMMSQYMQLRKSACLCPRSTDIPRSYPVQSSGPIRSCCLQMRSAPCASRSRPYSGGAEGEVVPGRSARVPELRSFCRDAAGMSDVHDPSCYSRETT
jgi:hypothetical protein